MQKTERYRQRVDDLEKEVIGLIGHFGITGEGAIGGDITDKENPLYLEYRLRGKNREYIAETKRIREKLKSLFKRNYPEIIELRNLHDRRSGVRRTYVIINPEISVGDGLELRYNLLQDMKKAIKDAIRMRGTKK